ncbi:hypothetical protein BpHYR1_052267 [Brachionus plicatilis]|uniref:Uncharacterized protein n=1 Tax=Brachionus plicatilis TaxID=10195 RepID=A0A3M7TAQ6_BRAPC|nr:hypothetical protein BpHYR1_052267 [Brachionus plicatilis]
MFKSINVQPNNKPNFSAPILSQLNRIPWQPLKALEGSKKENFSTNAPRLLHRSNKKNLSKIENP